MKKLLILFVAVLTFATMGVNAQTDSENVALTVILTDVFDLGISAGSAITFTFDTPAEWNLGMTAPDGGTTTDITVDATQDWEITIASPDLTDGGTGVMTADNVGVHCTDNGGNHSIGAEVSCAYTALGSPLALPNAATVLLDNGTGNAGDATDNAFSINWQCGTMTAPMNATSMLQHVASATFPTGTYTSTVVLTLQAD